MTDLDDLFTPLTPANPAAPAPRKCRHPRQSRWVVEADIESETYGCLRCRHTWRVADARRGRRNRSRGNAIERAVAKAVGGRRTGMYGGKDDVLADETFAFQVKSMATARFPGWMSTQLDALRAARTDRDPVLVVAEAPGPGHRARRLYVVDETTWLALHGPTREAA